MFRNVCVYTYAYTRVATIKRKTMNLKESKEAYEKVRREESGDKMTRITSKIIKKQNPLNFIYFFIIRISYLPVSQILSYQLESCPGPHRDHLIPSRFLNSPLNISLFKSHQNPVYGWYGENA